MVDGQEVEPRVHIWDDGVASDEGTSCAGSGLRPRGWRKASSETEVADASGSVDGGVSACS